nr:transposase family protein [Streptomyces sp. NBC_00886]
MGAAEHQLVFTDRLLATLIHHRHGTTYDVPAWRFRMDRSTITRAINEMWPLLAERGCTISPDVRLRTLAEVVDDLGTTGKTGIIDGTEIRARRPAQRRKNRDKFVSGKNKQNAVNHARARQMTLRKWNPSSEASLHRTRTGLGDRRWPQPRVPAPRSSTRTSRRRR